jgi:hypothetical protein
MRVEAPAARITTPNAKGASFKTRVFVFVGLPVEIRIMDGHPLRAKP